MQLDSGFTWGGFGAHVAVQFVAAVFGMLGALFVALQVYRRTRDDQRAIFQEEARRADRIRQEEEREQRSRIRAALHYEVADNLRRLEQFWLRIVLPSAEKNEPRDAAHRLVDTTVPVWTTGIWQGAAVRVALAITRKQLAETYRLYTILAEISETQRRLQVARDSDIAALVAQPETPSSILGGTGRKRQKTRYFWKAAENLIPDLDSGVKAVLACGNPIPSE